MPKADEVSWAREKVGHGRDVRANMGTISRIRGQGDGKTRGKKQERAVVVERSRDQHRQGKERERKGERERMIGRWGEREKDSPDRFSFNLLGVTETFKPW